MRASTRELYIEGVGFWASRLPGWQIARQVLRGDAPAPATAAVRPAPELLPAAERRRAPDTVAVALEVASRACESAQRDPKTLPSIFASTHGDLAISDSMCQTLAQSPALTSPTKFHNSVHNAAAGYWSIGTGSMQPYTALSASGCTFAQGLLEGAVQVHSSNSPVLYVAYDIEARGPLATMQPSRGVLGAALVLAPEPQEHTMARVRWEIKAKSDAKPTAPKLENAALVTGNAMAACLNLFEALAEARPRCVVQALAPHLDLHLQLEPV